MWKFVKSASSAHDYPRGDHKEVCFLGRSNVGKSTLINALAKSKVARVSSGPGHTRTINFYSDDRYYFVDLPGYGYARVSQQEHEKMLLMLEGYIQKRSTLKGFFLLIDAQVGPTSDDKIMIDYFQKKRCKFFIVVTKSDKANQSQVFQTNQIVKKITTNSMLVSARTGVNIAQLRHIVYQYLT